MYDVDVPGLRLETRTGLRRVFEIGGVEKGRRK